MVDRDVTVDFNADVSGYTAGATQAIALTKEYTSTLDGLIGGVAKVGNALSTGMVDSMAKLVRTNETATSAAAAYQQQLSSLEGAVSVTTGNFGKMEKQVKALAREMPIGIGGAVRQFEQLQKVGVPTEQVAGLAKAFTQLEGATGESGAALATMGVQFSRTFNSGSLRGITNLNDSLVKTSREFGASATGVMSFANAIAPMAKQAGLAQTEVVGMSAAFSRMGEDGYRAANALTKMMGDMDRSVREGSSEMTIYANTVGMTREKFTELYKSDPSEAFTRVFEALNRQGPDAIRTLEAMGLEGTRTMRSIQTVVGQGNLREVMETAQESYGGGATATAAEKAFGGLNDQMTKLGETMNQTVAAAGTPFLGFLEGVAGAANSVAGAFQTVASSGALKSIVEIGGTLAATTAGAAGLGSIVTGLGIGKGILGGTGGAGRGAAAFLGNNRGKMLAAGAAGVAMSGMGAPGMGMMLPLLAGGFMGNQTLRNISIRGGEGFFTNIGSQAGMTLKDISAGKDIPRTAASQSYKMGQQLLRESGAGVGARAGFMATYAKADPTLFRADVDDVLDKYTAGQLSQADAKARLQSMDPAGSQGGRFRQGGTAAARMIRYGGGGALKGLAGAGLAMAGGPVGLGLMGAVGAGMGMYSSYTQGRERKEATTERMEANDTTSALNDMRTALGLTTVAATDFAEALSGATAETLAAEKGGLDSAYRLSEEEKLYAAGKESVLGFQGSAQMQANQALALMGPGSDEDYVRAIMLDVAAANKSSPETLSEIESLIQQGKGGSGSAQAAVATIGDMSETREGFFNFTNVADVPVLGPILGQFQGMTDKQSEMVDSMADATNQRVQKAYEAQGSQGVARETRTIAEEQAAGIQQLMEQTLPSFGGQQQYGYLGQAEKEAIESLAQQTLNMSPEEAARFAETAAEKGTEAALEYYETETGAGQAVAEQADEEDKQLRSQLEELFSLESGAFDEMLPALKELRDSNMNVTEFLEANRGSLDSTTEAVLSALASPGDVGKQMEAGQALAADIMAGGAPAQSLAELQTQRGTAAAGTEQRQILDQADIEARSLMQRERMNLTSVGAQESVIQQGAAVLQEVTQNGYDADPQIAAQQRQDIEAAKDAFEAEKQWMIQRLQQQREYGVQRTRMIEQFDIGMTRQQASFDRQRGYAQEQFQRQQAYSEQDFHRSRARAVEDFGLSMVRAEEDYQLSITRAQEDYQKQRARSFEDYRLSMQREAEDWAINMQRIAEDMAASFMDPFTRVGPQQTWSTGGLLRNIERQAELAREQLATLDELREAGLSQGAIDTLNLADPSMARQVSRMGGMSAEEIAQLNASVGDREDIAEGYMAEDRDLRRQEEDRKKSLERQADDFNKALARTSEDFQLSLARGAEDFQKAMARSNDDFNKQLARSWEDFLIQTTRAQEEFRISMEIQLAEFNISMAQAREDHQRQLTYMEEDLQRSGEQIHGDYEAIAKAYMEMMSGDAEAYKSVTTDTVQEMRTILADRLSQVPGDVAFALGDAAWMFGLGNFNEKEFEAQLARFTSAIRAGFSDTAAKEYALTGEAMTHRPDPSAYGGEYSDESWGAGGRLMPAGSYSIGRGPGGHGYNAVDLPAPMGTPLYAPWAGQAESKYEGSFGFRTKIRRGDGMVFLGAHQRQMGVTGPVAAGQQYGVVGSTGSSTGPHLHAEVYRAGTARDAGGSRQGLLNPRSWLVYDTGGILPHGGGAVNLSGKPEAVISDSQWRSLRYFGDELAKLNSGVAVDPRGMGVLGEIVGRHIDAWETKASRVSGFATAAPHTTTQTFDQSTKVTGPIQVVSNDPVDMGRKIATRSRRRRAFQPIGGGR